MITFVGSTFILLPVLYTLLVVAYAQVFVERQGGVAAIARPLLLVTAALHASVLVLRGIELRAFPVSGASEVFSLVAFVVLSIYLTLEWRLGPRNSTGIFVVFFAFLLQAAASVVHMEFDSATAVVSLGPSAHVFSGVVGVAAVAVSSIYGLLFLFLYRSIKQGRFGLYYRRMPDLDALTAINYWAATIAFAALSLAAGVDLWDYLSPEQGGAGGAELLFSMALWALYGIAITARRFFGLGGKRLAYTTVLGLLLGLAVLVSGLPGSGATG